MWPRGIEIEAFCLRSSQLAHLTLIWFRRRRWSHYSDPEEKRSAEEFTSTRLICRSLGFLIEELQDWIMKKANLGRMRNYRELLKKKKKTRWNEEKKWEMEYGFEVQTKYSRYDFPTSNFFNYFSSIFFLFAFSDQFYI